MVSNKFIINSVLNITNLYNLYIQVYFVHLTANRRTCNKDNPFERIARAGGPGFIRNDQTAGKVQQLEYLQTQYYELPACKNLLPPEQTLIDLALSFDITAVASGQTGCRGKIPNELLYFTTN